MASGPDTMAMAAAAAHIKRKDVRTKSRNISKVLVKLGLGATKQDVTITITTRMYRVFR